MFSGGFRCKWVGLKSGVIEHLAQHANIILMPTSTSFVFHNFLRNLSFLSSIANLFHRREPITLQVSMLNIHMTPAHLCIVLILYFGVDGNQAWLIHHGTIECGGAETFVASVNTCYSFISNWMAGVCGIVRDPGLDVGEGVYTARCSHFKKWF
jgi:hypothetical protein